MNGLPRPRTLLLLVALFIWFNSGVEAWRQGETQEIKARPWMLVVKPWQGLRAFVSRDGDERLYFQYAELMFGRTPDLDYMAGKDVGDRAAALARLRALIRPGTAARLPYRDFPVEYPPVPLALMLLPRFFVSSLAAYRPAVGACLALLYLLACWLGARLAGLMHTSEPERVWRRLGWMAFALGPLLCARFDILPATLVAGALHALARRRDWLAGVLFGVAIMTKLYPLLLLLPACAFLWGQGERRRALLVPAIAAAAALLVAAPFLLAAPAPFLRSVFLYGARPYQFETLVGSLVLALHGPAALVGSFGSMNVATPAWLARLGDLALWGCVLALAVAAHASGRRLREATASEQTHGLVGWVFAALVAILVLSRVLSPQFIIWLCPLAAVFAQTDRRLFRTALLTAALTHVFFPVLYDLAVDGKVVGVATLVLRNACLVALAVLAVKAAQAARPAPPP